MDVSEAEFLRQREKFNRLYAEAVELCAEVKQKIEHLAWTVDSIRRQWRPDFFQPLHDAIRVVHGCESRHLCSHAVRKVSNGVVLWLGMVEEFALEGMDGAGVCYAWPYMEDGQPRTFALLKQGTIDSPQAAVQFYLLARSTSSVAKLPAYHRGSAQLPP